MINVIKYEDEGTLPISVIVPLSKKRKYFFDNFVLPMLEANMTAEIIINDDEGSAPKKRNDGFQKSTQPYVFFCDDDIVIPKTYLEKLYNAIKNNDFGFAYSGYYGIVQFPENHPIGRNFSIPTKIFNAEELKWGNYISTMSLIKRDIFPMFDEKLKRLQDYSLWLTIVERGGKGIAVFNNEFYAYYLDSGITSNTNSEIDAINAIRAKHNI